MRFLYIVVAVIAGMFLLAGTANAATPTVTQTPTLTPTATAVNTPNLTPLVGDHFGTAFVVVDLDNQTTLQAAPDSTRKPGKCRLYVANDNLYLVCNNGVQRKITEVPSP